MNPQNQQNPNDYDPSQIKYLEPRQHVRLRPGMYIGGTDKRALHHMVWEVLDDAISEFENTSYNEITISLLPDRTISVSDNGIGFPVSKSEEGTFHIEWYMTKIGIGGRYQLRESQFFPSGGLHGIGLQAINSLSSFCQVEVKREGFLWRQSYSEGLPTSSLEQTRPLEAGESTGTSISFTPDFTIMEENDFDFELISQRCQELAYLLPQLRFTVQDKRENEREISYHYSQGLLEWLKSETAFEAVMIKPVMVLHNCELLDWQDNPYVVKVHLGFQWLWGDKYRLSSYVNTIATPEGGKHVNSLKTALERQVGLSWNDLEDGFIGIIHILHPDPQLESQTRIRLLNPDVILAVEEAIEALFAAHPEAKAAIQAHFSQR